jgi:hypothetical protein
MFVKYEDLIMQPNETISTVVQFLGLTWTDNFLKHDAFVGDRVRVSDTEWSSGQVKKAIYTSSLTNWVGKFSYDARIVKLKASMLTEFGYEVKSG